MRRFLKSGDFLLVMSFGNFMLWAGFCFLILGGCAFGQEPYKLSKIGPFKWDFNNAHPVLWWINYVHTITQAVSVPMMVVLATRIFREDGEGVRSQRFRLLKKMIGGGKKA